MAAAADKSKPYIPHNSGADDRWSTDDTATATCFCGAVQLSFPTQGPGLIDTFVCNCTDCRKITASMFASNFVVADAHLKHIRGRDALRAYSQSRTIRSGSAMANHFCGVCGTLMYRVGAAFPGCSILRVGTVDDFSLHETRLRPRVEQFVEDRVGWFTGVAGAEAVEGSYYKARLQGEGGEEAGRVVL
ncbi:Mss4-like protein [Hypoxylon sp. FL0543]|nr:Mss4-like protein [Hypoxylon sp. FL0543]